MSNIGMLEARLSELKNKLLKYEKDIETLKIEIRGNIDLLNENSATFDFDSLVEGFKGLQGGGLDISSLYDENGIIDYSVSFDDLSVYKKIYIDGEEYVIYSSSKTDALYVISDNPYNTNYGNRNTKCNEKRKKLYRALKEELENDQMVIVTFDNKPFQGNVYDSSKSTRDFGFVAKNGDGKTMSFVNALFHNEKKEPKWPSASIPSKSLIVTYKGFAIPEKGVFCAETGSSFDMQVMYQNDDVNGIISTQSGLTACQPFVQKEDLTAHDGKGQDELTARFIFEDPVIEKYCDRCDHKATSYLTAFNRNNYDVDHYHTYFDGFEVDDERGYLGTHSSILKMALVVDQENTTTYKSGKKEFYWNNFCFTFEGTGGQKEMWSTQSSYYVDNWDDVQVR